MAFKRLWAFNSVFLVVTVLSLVTLDSHAATNPKFYHLYRVQNGIEFWITNINRCDDTQSFKEISKVEADKAISHFSQVFPKLENLIKKIESVDVGKSTLVRRLTQKLAIFIDPADSVICTGEANFSLINTEYRPSIYLSVTGALASSWKTVVAHEFSHLIFGFLGLSSNGLEESWADLLAISVNDYRPYIGEGDGPRIVNLVNQKVRDPKVSDRSKTIYGNSCPSNRAYRDFTLKSPLIGAYRSLQEHNASCYFVKAFLDSTSTSEERDRLLYGYLFSSDSSSRKYFHSSDYTKTLIELTKSRKVSGKPSEAGPSTAVRLQSQSHYDGRVVTVELILPDGFEATHIKESNRPLAFEIYELEEFPLFRWTSEGFSTGMRELSEVENCNEKRIDFSSCACIKSSKITGKITFLNKLNILTSVLATTEVKPGCYIALIQ